MFPRFQLFEPLLELLQSLRQRSGLGRRGLGRRGLGLFGLSRGRRIIQPGLYPLHWRESIRAGL